uniref:Uncharacterized protein n=1 Tax=Romanomermis culicivorax TaxID=13658 RepID=A0A915K957_ROMCU
MAIPALSAPKQGYAKPVYDQVLLPISRRKRLALSRMSRFCKVSSESRDLYTPQKWSEMANINDFTTLTMFVVFVSGSGADESQTGLGFQSLSLMYMFPTPMLTRLP